MSPAPAVTKLEQAAESIEELIISIVDGHTHPTAAKYDKIVVARKELRNALAEFLRPALRLVHDAPPNLSGNGSLQE